MKSNTPHSHVDLKKLPTENGKPQVSPLNSPRFKHGLFKHVDNPIVELNDIPKARAPWAVVRKHSNCSSPETLAPDTFDNYLDP
jgi:hypothetical protein